MERCGKKVVQKRKKDLTGPTLLEISGCGIEHRQCLLASVQIASYNSHSASFDPSAVRGNITTVFSARREADLVMTSTGKIRPGTTIGARSRVSAWRRYP